MTITQTSGLPQRAPAKSNWLRRAVLGTAFAAAGFVTLGAGTSPAQAYWYHGWGYWHPHYVYYYHPYYYGGYYPAYWGGWGWRGGWGYGWGWHHWHHW